MSDVPQHGSWWSYPVYAAGLAVGALSPQEWLVTLSLLAVVLRIVIDLPKFVDVFIERRPFRRFVAWVRSLFK